MRILAISNYYPPLEIGGWEQLTRDVVEELISRGHEVFILTGNHRADEVSFEPGVNRVLQLESPDHIHYHIKYTFSRRRTETENIRLLTEAVGSFNPDIIFINGMWNLPVSIALVAEKLLPHRVVYYVASYWPLEPDAHSAYWRHGGTLKLIFGRIMTRTFAKPALRNTPAFERVLCVSEFMRRKLIDGGAVSEKNSRVVFNGINPKLFKPSNRPPSDKLHLLYAGRLSPDKGVHIAIEAVALLSPENKARVSLTIVGSGTPEYTARLETLRQTLGIVDSVELRGQVPREAMPRILANHDVLLLLSIWDEPLARMTQEAMAAGLAVIGTPTGGTPEILYDGKNGLWVEPGNPSELAGKISRLLEDVDLRQKFGILARETIQEKFTFNRMVDELEENFADVLAQSISSQSTGVKT